MARLQLQILRRICSFSNPSSFRVFPPCYNYAFSKSLGYDEGRVCKGLARGDFLAHLRCASIIRTLTTEGGKDGEDGDTLHHSTKVDGGQKYSVVQIDSDGTWRTVLRNAVEIGSEGFPLDNVPVPRLILYQRSGEQANWNMLLMPAAYIMKIGLTPPGVHPRDVSILASPTPFISQRSIITVHNEKILVRMENVKALLSRDHVLLFESRRPRSFKGRDIVGAAPSIADSQEEAADRARELFAVFMSQQARAPISHVLDAMPFHLRMLECLLDDTSTFFYQKTERLKVVVERMLEELTDDVNMGGLQRLLPLKRALTEVEHDVRDTHDALEEVLSSDEMLAAICLNKKELQWSFLKGSDAESENEDCNRPTLRQAAADMLLTYQRQIANAGGALEELRKDIDATQEIWELGLDTTRNRIIQMDLMFNLGTLSMGVAALVAGYFGMNLPSGFEENSTAFWWVVFGSMGFTFSFGTFLVFLVRVWPRVIDRRRARELAGLRELLQHLDDVDDIFQAVAREVAGKAVTPKEFKKILQSHPTARFMRQREVEMMFRMFDTDRNGLLEDIEFLGKDKKKDRRGRDDEMSKNCGRL